MTITCVCITPGFYATVTYDDKYITITRHKDAREIIIRNEITCETKRYAIPDGVIYPTMTVKDGTHYIRMGACLEEEIIIRF
jgi:hypothetical protein